MFYAIGRELFSGSSESGLYNRAYKIVKNNDDVSLLPSTSVAWLA
jgi:hypothetical protein